LRKRAPKLDRNGRFGERLSRRPPAPSLPRLRRGEIPGIRHDTRPYATIVLVLLGLAGCLVWRTNAIDLANLVVLGKVGSQWWRVFSAPSVYDNTGYAFVVLSAIALYGTLLERRHGPLLVIALALLGGVGGAALAAQFTNGIVTGGNGAALALLVAWAMEDLVAVNAGHEIDGDLIGTGVFAVVIALMPLAVGDASWIADGVGVVAGAVVGYPLARMHPSAA
jgi:hypothetical protein